MSESTQPRHTVTGSERAEPVGAKRLKKADKEERIEVTLHLRPRRAIPPPARFAAPQNSKRRYLSRKRYGAMFGLKDIDLRAVEAFAFDNNMDIAEVNPGARTVTLSGTVAAMENAFAVSLYNYQTKPGTKTFRAHTGPLSVPSNLAQVIQAVLGLDTFPVAKPHYRVASRAPEASFNTPELAKLYQFPKGVTGKGQCIALIELGGGFRPKDLQDYFSSLQIAPAPKVVGISVNGAHNNPGSPDGADAEVMLDIEVSGAIAPGARIAVYFAPNTDAGFSNAINKAIHDNQRKPSVISISWGAPEDSWSDQSRNVMDQAFQAAAALGITVLVAAGDDGSSDGETDGKVHVDFPASSPYVTACGGTTLVAAEGKITSETVWNASASGDGATGGGVSIAFARPGYQVTTDVPVNPDTSKSGRGIPDVAGVADPMTGYNIRVDGQNLVVGGTSAVAPLYAGLISLVNQKKMRAKKKRAGFINLALYANTPAGKGFRDVLEGNNGAYKAQKGWDACTGWGSPQQLQKAL